MVHRRSVLRLVTLGLPLLRMVLTGLGPRRVPVVLLETTVAGFRYHRGPTIEDTLHAGDPLELVREPSNPFDPRAIAIHHPTGLRLGYVPRVVNLVPSNLLDQRMSLSARIIDVRPSPAPPWERLLIRIDLEEP